MMLFYNLEYEIVFRIGKIFVKRRPVSRNEAVTLITTTQQP